MFDVANILGSDLCSQLLDTANRKGAIEPMVTIQDGRPRGRFVGKPGEAGEKSGDAVISWKRDLVVYSTIVDGQTRSSS